MGIAVRNHDLSNRWFKAVAKRAAAGILALGALCACGGGGGGGTPAPAPVIKTFQATPSTILAGGSVTLSAAYGNGAGTVDQGVGALAAGGSVQVKPTKDTTYTLTVKDGKNAPVQAQASVKVLPAPAVAISLSATQAQPGATGLTASVAASEGAQYVWKVTGGDLTGGQGTPAITFDAKSGQAVTVALAMTDSLGNRTGSAGQVSLDPAVAPLSIAFFAAAPGLVTAGDSAGLTAVFPAGTGQVDQGVGAVTSGTPFQVAPGADTTYTLTVSSGANSVTAETSVRTAPRPSAAITLSADTAGPGAKGLGASVPFQPGASYAWDVKGGDIVSGAGTEAIVFDAGQGPEALVSVTVTNAAGTPAAGSAKVAVSSGTGQGLAIRSFTVSPAFLPAGGKATLQADFTGGTGEVNLGVGTVQPGQSVQVAPAADTTYVLTVTGPSGAQATARATVKLIPATGPNPVKVVCPASVTAGQGGYVASVVDEPGCKYEWTVTGGAESGGQGTHQITFTAGTGATVQFLVKVTGPSGAQVQDQGQSAVTGLPVQPVITGPAGGTVNAGQAGLTATVADQPGCSFTWSVTGGTASGANTGTSFGFRAGAPGALRLTCVATNPAGLASSPGTLDLTAQDGAPAKPTVTLAALLTAGKAYQAATEDQGAWRSYTWTVINGTVQGAGDTPAVTIVPTAPGPLNVSVKVSSAGGSDSGAVPATVFAPPQAGIFAQDRIFPNQPGNRASVPPQTGASYAWSFTATTGTPTLTASAAGADGAVFGYTAGPALGRGNLVCTVTNGAGDTATGSFPMAVVRGTVLKDAAANQPRRSALATPLTDGRVLVTGGLDWNDVCQASSELMDPYTNTWRDTAPMATERSGHISVRLLDGRVLVAGGVRDTTGSPASFLASAEVFDPATGTWSATGSMPFAAHQAAAELLPDGRVMVCGGLDQLGAWARTAIWNPATGTWSPGASMRFNRSYHTANALPDGRIMVVGGYSSAVTVQNTAELYNPADNTWADAPGPMSHARYSHRSTVVRDSLGKFTALVVTGGRGLDGASMASAEFFDPKKNQWGNLPDLPFDISDHVAAFFPAQGAHPEGGLLVAGGADYHHGSAPGDLNIFLYSSVAAVGDLAKAIDAVENGGAAFNWTPISRMPNGRAFSCAAVVPGGGVLIAGGLDRRGEAQSAPLVCHPDQATFEVTGSLPGTAVGGLLAGLPDGRAILVGGAGSDGSMLDSRIYDPAGNSWGDVIPMQEARAKHQLTTLPDGRLVATGGETNNDPDTDSVEIFDPSTSAWTLVATPMAFRREGHTATYIPPVPGYLPSGGVAVAGGFGRAAGALAGDLESVEILNLATLAWEPGVPDMGGPRRGHSSAFLANGTLLEAGGDSGGAQDSETLRIQPALAWSAPLAMLTLRYNAGSILLADGRFLMVGGNSTENGGAGSLTWDSTELLAPGGAWVAGPTMGEARSYSSVLQLPAPDGRVFAVGGIAMDAAGTTTFPGAAVMDPAAGTPAWKSLGKGWSRFGQTAIRLPDGRIMVVGGIPTSMPEFWLP